MTNDVDLKNSIERIDVEIICVYLLILANILYLVLFYKERAGNIDKLYNTNSADKYPDTSNYSDFIVTLLLIAGATFLYYSYENLQNSIIEYKKTGNNTDLESDYIGLYANILQFSGTLFSAYDVFVNGNDVANII